MSIMRAYREFKGLNMNILLQKGKRWCFWLKVQYNLRSNAKRYTADPWKKKEKDKKSNNPKINNDKN